MSREIFKAMNQEVKEEGKSFIVVLLPTDEDIFESQDNSDFIKEWMKVAQELCNGDYHCFDLLPALKNLTKEMVDYGHSGDHYGPKMNKIIAQEIKHYLLYSEILLKNNSNDAQISKNN